MLAVETRRGPPPRRTFLAWLTLPTPVRGAFVAGLVFYEDRPQACMAHPPHFEGCGVAASGGCGRSHTASGARRRTDWRCTGALSAGAPATLCRSLSPNKILGVYTRVSSPVLGALRSFQYIGEAVFEVARLGRRRGGEQPLGACITAWFDRALRGWQRATPTLHAGCLSHRAAMQPATLSLSSAVTLATETLGCVGIDSLCTASRQRGGDGPQPAAKPPRPSHEHRVRHVGQSAL